MADDSFTNGEPPPTGRTLRIVGGIDEMREDLRALQLMVKGTKWVKIIAGALSAAFLLGIAAIVYVSQFETKTHAETVALEHKRAHEETRKEVEDLRIDHAALKEKVEDTHGMVKRLYDHFMK